MVNVSLPEAATQFGYRIGDKGTFTDPGFIDALDQRTGQRSPKTYFEMPPDQGKTTIYVTWRDKRSRLTCFPSTSIQPARFPASRRRCSSNSGRAGSHSGNSKG